ncbi:nucleolar complex protein 4 homolog [Phtheirospermum japonicum]|uniref:Nucleolar complex protein 4 homolog n=1 Tax=Phtheirospermum japonicum TaxID=374723 RepID=A0A830B7I0_9LAMI|nr:nucleolar complex protein 4 homolog [Phtheirospermum japonicum]
MGLGGISHPIMRLRSLIEARDLYPSPFREEYDCTAVKLLDSCLKSSLRPAYLATRFCKNLSRLALFVPPSGALVIIVLVYNLLQRHPSINCLVHREDKIAVLIGSIADDIHLKDEVPGIKFTSSQR